MLARDTLKSFTYPYGETLGDTNMFGLTLSVMRLVEAAVVRDAANLRQYYDTK